MADETPDSHKSKTGSFLKKALKWTFKAAVLGVGIWAGGVFIEEFLFYGLMHGTSPLSIELAHLSKSFTDPIIHWISDGVGGAAGLGWLQGILDGLHSLVGIEGAFDMPVPGDIDTSAFTATDAAAPALEIENEGGLFDDLYNDAPGSNEFSPDFPVEDGPLPFDFQPAGEPSGFANPVSEPSYSMAA